MRSRAIGHAMAPPRFTAKWQSLKPAERRLSGVRAAELATPAEEAMSSAPSLFASRLARPEAAARSPAEIELVAWRSSSSLNT